MKNEDQDGKLKISNDILKKHEKRKKIWHSFAIADLRGVLIFNVSPHPDALFIGHFEEKEKNKKYDFIYVLKSQFFSYCVILTKRSENSKTFKIFLHKKDMMDFFKDCVFIEYEEKEK